MMELSLEYIAGFFDGEGSVGVYSSVSGPKRSGPKSKIYRLTVSLGQVDPRVVRHLHERWGGSLRCYERSKKNPDRQDAWYWYATSAKAARFLQDIAPYSVGKREQIEVALEFYSKRLPVGKNWSQYEGSNPGPEYSDRLKKMKRGEASLQ